MHGCVCTVVLNKTLRNSTRTGKYFLKKILYTRKYAVKIYGVSAMQLEILWKSSLTPISKGQVVVTRALCVSSLLQVEKKKSTYMNLNF